MEKDFIDILKNLIANEGKETLLDQKKCKAYLPDYTKNDYKKESRWLLQAVEVGTARAIDSAGDLALCKKQQIQKLEEEFAMNAKTAADLVNTFAYVLRGEKIVTESETTIAARKAAAEQAAALKAAKEAADRAVAEKAAAEATAKKAALEKANAEAAAKKAATEQAAVKQTNTYKAVQPKTKPLIEMVWIPAGKFIMGSPETDPNHESDETQHSVTLTQGFYMGKYQVTQEQWKMVMGYNPSYHSSSPAIGEIQERRPVEMVSWFDAIEFCNKLSVKEGLEPVYTISGRTPASGYPITDASVTPNWKKNGYRLPTEAQWEYACRAGTTTAWSFGNTDKNLNNYSWYEGNSGDKTHEIGKKLPNPWGLYDIHGNVHEWCWDCKSAPFLSESAFRKVSNEPKTDPTGLSSGPVRVTRGGANSSKAIQLRSASQYKSYPNSGGGDTGFRVIRPANVRDEIPPECDDDDDDDDEEFYW